MEPPRGLRAWQDLVARRRDLIQQRTEAKNGTRRLLRNDKIIPPRTPGVWTKAGRKWLAGLQFSTPHTVLRRDALLRQVESLDQQIRQVEAELRRLASDSPDVLRLVQMTGFGFRTAEAVLAALEEWRRRHT